MPIRVIRGDESPRDPLENPDATRIVIEASSTVKTAPVFSEKTKGIDLPQGIGIPTTWVSVLCQCTMTGGIYQLVFRREGGSFVLKAADTAHSASTLTSLDAIEGPFEWAAFVCPECGINWATKVGDGVEYPVVQCGCGSLFCTSHGIHMKKSKKVKGDSEWWFKCPKCRQDCVINRRISSVDGEAAKGK